MSSICMVQDTHVENFVKLQRGSIPKTSERTRQFVQWYIKCLKLDANHEVEITTWLKM